MTNAADIHRGSEASRLQKVIESAPEGLSIVAVSGPGGVGKTFLVSHVLEAMKPAQLGYLTLGTNAANPETRHDFFGLLESLFRPSLDPPALPNKDYFPRLRAIAGARRKLVQEAVTEMAKRGAPDAVQQLAKAILRTGRAINTAIPSTRSVVNLTGLNESLVGEALNTAWDLMGGVKHLQESTSLWAPVRDILQITHKNRLKQDLYGLATTEIRIDLAAALTGHDDGLNRLVRTPIPGLSRLLLVLDDYEAIQGVLDEFLTGALIPELARAPFRTVFVVLGRDDLETTGPGWAQHCRRHLRDQIRVEPFDRPSANDVFAAAGIPEPRWDALYEATRGYPYLLDFAVEEAADQYAVDSITFLMRFIDRTTRWMTEEERSWFLRICYLDRVNEDTLRALFPNEDVTRIQTWFEKEPSIRDPSAGYFRVRPMVREKVLRYLEMRGPGKHKELLGIAEAAERAENA